MSAGSSEWENRFLACCERILTCHLRVEYCQQKQWPHASHRAHALSATPLPTVFLIRSVMKVTDLFCGLLSTLLALAERMLLPSPSFCSCCLVWVGADFHVGALQSGRSPHASGQWRAPCAPAACAAGRLQDCPAPYHWSEASLSRGSCFVLKQGAACEIDWRDPRPGSQATESLAWSVCCSESTWVDSTCGGASLPSCEEDGAPNSSMQQQPGDQMHDAGGTR